MGLILHCGAKEVAYQQLKDYQVTPRNHSWVNDRTGKQHFLNRSERWAGIQHYDFAKTMVDTCLAFNMPVDMENSQWGVSEEGSDLFALLKFREWNDILNKPSVASKFMTNGVMPSMGLRHSNRGRFSAQGTIGGSVTVCDNLMITGTFIFKHKHTTGNVANLAESIANGTLQFIQGLPSIKQTTDHLQERSMDDKDVGNFYMQLGREKLIPWSHIGKVDKYWLHPTHDEFRRHKTAWRMYNAVNTVVKEYNPMRQFEVVGKTTKLLTEAY